MQQCTAKGSGVSVLGAGCLQSWQLPAGTENGPGPCNHKTLEVTGDMAVRRLQGDPWLHPHTPLSQKLFALGLMIYPTANV